MCGVERVCVAAVFLAWWENWLSTSSRISREFSTERRRRGTEAQGWYFKITVRFWSRPCRSRLQKARTGFCIRHESDPSEWTTGLVSSCWSGGLGQTGVGYPLQRAEGSHDDVDPTKTSSLFIFRRQLPGRRSFKDGCRGEMPPALRTGTTLAISTNIVMQTVNGPYPATSKGSDEKKRGSRLSLMMLIKSSPWNFQRRKNARETWLALAQSNYDGKKLHFHGNKPFHWKFAQKEDFVWSHRFVLGLALNRADGSNVTEVVFKEQRYYRDILLYPGVEDTAKTSWKVMWELAYVTKHQMFEYLLLLEDDSFVRFDLVVQYLSANHHDNSVVYSGCLSSEYRDMPDHSGSHLSSNSVPAVSFVNGAGTILSKRVVHQLLVQAQSMSRTQWDPTEDEFIGKLCRKAGIYPENLMSVHLRPWDRDRVELFDCGSSDEDIELTMISKHLPREMFNRMTSGVGSLKLCPCIRIRQKRSKVFKRYIPKDVENAWNDEMTPEVHVTQTRTVKDSVPGVVEKVKYSRNLWTEQIKPDSSQSLSLRAVIVIGVLSAILVLFCWCACRLTWGNVSGL